MVRLGLSLLVMPIVTLMGVYFWELGNVRECTLNGGFWDYAEGVCRDQPQPFVSWLERYPWLVNGGMVVALLGAVMCLSGLFIRRR